MSKSINIEKVKEFMQLKGLNQTSLADAVGVSRNMVSLWFKGESQPRANKLLKLALSLGVKVNDLYNEKPKALPRVEFRKRGNCKITDEYKVEIQRNVRILDRLAPYLPEGIKAMNRINNANTDYAFLQRQANEFRRTFLNMTETDHLIAFGKICDYLSNTGTVVVPTLWNKGQHKATAFHAHLTDKDLRFIYINADTSIFDIRFWFLHEIAHILTPYMEEGSEESENFADAFAGAVLFPRNLAEALQSKLISAASLSARKELLINTAKELRISPISIFKELEKYCNFIGETMLLTGKDVYPLTAIVQKSTPSAAKVIFDNREEGSALDFINGSQKHFKTPFFESLKRYLSEEEKGSGAIARMMCIPQIDALEFYKALTLNEAK